MEAGDQLMGKAEMCREVIARRPEYGSTKKVWYMSNMELEGLLRRIRKEDGVQTDGRR